MQLMILSLALGLTIGAFSYWLYHRLRLGTYQALVTEMVQKAELDAEKIKNEAELAAKQFHLDKQREIEERWLNEKRKLQESEIHLKTREEKIEERMGNIEEKLSHIEKKELSIDAKKKEIEEKHNLLQSERDSLRSQLEKVAGLTSSEGKALLLDQLKNEVHVESANLIRKKTKEAEEEAEKACQRILATAINRLAVPCVSEVSVHTVPLPSEEMKGRIIGREGRNIRTLERATGVNYVIDDTPGAVILSGFDPIRLHTAKLALTDLLSTGRIHPSSIEEAVARAEQDMEKQVRAAGEDAALRAGQSSLAPQLINLLGKLNFRYSLGQNVLEHSLEVSHLMGIIAAELRLDAQLAKRIGLLHDIGKAVSHEVEGTHALIGQELALRYGESESVANGIGCHHNEIEPKTVEGSFCGAADAISASRPGARVEAVEEYLKRVRRLEDLAYEFPGIEKAYAMQAGRELCIVVLPDMIDDQGTIHLARDLSKRIEEELQYPGKIKVTVIRERRAVEYAV